MFFLLLGWVCIWFLVQRLFLLQVIGTKPKEKVSMNQNKQAVQMMSAFDVGIGNILCHISNQAYYDQSPEWLSKHSIEWHKNSNQQCPTSTQVNWNRIIDVEQY